MSRTTFLIIALLFASCVSSVDNESTNKINRIIKETGQESRFSDDVKKVFFVNIDQGCESCIDKSLLFIKKQQKNPKMLFFILSSYSNTLTKTIKDYSLHVQGSNIVIDKGLLSNKAGLVDVFPVMYYLEGKNVKERRLVDASNISKTLVND